MNKFLSFFTILFYSLAFLTSCNSDDAVDLCENIVCVNGGTCVNGICDCPEGFSGPDCSNQLAPSIITITKVRVTKYPATTSNGAGWDLTSGPDIYPAIFDADNNLVWKSNTYKENASSQVYDFVIPNGLEIDKPEENLVVIGLYDFDSIDQDDLMGWISTYLYLESNGFPEVISLNSPASSVGFELDLEYEW